MKKVPTIFERDWGGDRSRVTTKRNPLCSWVFEGEGVATRKFDGTAVMVESGQLWCRYDVKNGKQPPTDFKPAQESADEETGHWPGWVPAGNDPQYKWQRKAYETMGALSSGTYEACGPHFQGNPEHLETDILIPHGNHRYIGCPTTFVELREWLEPLDTEGIVWHHPDGRMAKIKKRDFGLRRK